MREVVRRERIAGCIASASTAVFALAAGLLAWSTHTFQLGDTLGVVSWVTLNDYPIHREPIAFVGALACVGAGVWGGHRCWIELGRRVSQQTGLPLETCLRSIAIGSIGLMLSGLGIASGVWSVWRLLALPSLATALTAAVAWRWRDPLSARLDRPKPPPNDEPKREASRYSATQRAGLALFGAIVLYLFLYDAGLIFLLPIDTLHEGERLAHLTMLQHGGVPYRDFFVQHGLGQDVGKAWLSATVLDGTLAALRLTDCAIRPIGALSIYLLGLAFFRSWITAALLVLLLTAGELTVHDRLAFGLLAVAALVRGLRLGSTDAIDPSASVFRPARGWVVGSGALTAAAFLYSTEVGLYAGAACGTTLLLLCIRDRDSTPVDRARPLAFYAVGFSTGLAPLLVYLAAQGALDDFARNTWMQVGLQGTVWGLAFPPIDEALRATRTPGESIDLLFSRPFRFYLPALILLGWTGAAVHRSARGVHPATSKWPAIGCVLIFGIALFASALGRSDDRHLMYAMAPAYVLLMLGFESWGFRALRLREAGGLARTAIPFALVAALFTAWWITLHPPIGKHFSRVARLVTGATLPGKDRPVVWSPLGEMGAMPTQLAYLKGVTDYIDAHTEPGEPFYDFTNQAAFYYFADRPSPTRYVFVGYAATPSLQREVIEALELERPKLVLYGAGHEVSHLDGIPAARRHPLIDAYLRSHYEPSARVGGAKILRRR